jgi:hypothetical protein
MPDFRYLIDNAKRSILGLKEPNTVTESKTPAVDNLFTKVDPAVDGDDCNHDCASCDIKYPRKFSIDETDEIYGNIKAWSTHVLVATGKTDWVRDVGDEKGSIMEAFDKTSVKPSNGVRYLHRQPFTRRSSSLLTNWLLAEIKALRVEYSDPNTP